MDDCFRHKNQDDALTQFAHFLWVYEMYERGHFLCKDIDLLH